MMRCPWPGVDPLYVAYHDEEWGVPEYDDRAMFEKLVSTAFRPGSPGSPSCASARLPQGVRRLRPQENRALERQEKGRADAGRRHRPQPGQDRGDGGAGPHRARFLRTKAASRATCGALSTDARSTTRGAVSRTCRPRPTSLAPSRRTCARGAAISSARPSSTPSCRRPASSMIISSIAAVTRPAGRWRANSTLSESRAAPGLAADAVGTAARPHRPLAARRRDRRHRAWSCARRSLERSDEGARDLFRRATFALGGSVVRRWGLCLSREARLAALLHDAPNM